ncbi:urease accessory protein UreE [Sediminimonas qiaohouensis]|uniref:urease accessory protein UreE n=1 Tax=Sediminimonas qiaohouensis TaxID=552061 RepID=UPI000415E43C|nr:urease accessory protein UreE [Sediminimonas qiaohouensis]
MTELPLAQTLKRAGDWTGGAETCTLDYDARFLRRKRMTTDGGAEFLVDLQQTVSLEDGDALILADGGAVCIRAATEPVFIVTGANLARLAWHIGNRHTPCQVEADRLVIRRDPVIGHMLNHLGATVTEGQAPFRPEAGAYGHGRTHSHAHGATAHAV